MSKFKVGDRIRRVYNASPWAPIGYETVVTGVPENLTYTDINGDKDICARACDWELVRDGPVRTVTRLEPVEGKHGIVQLDVHNGQIVVTISPEDGRQPSGDALRSAAMILSQIAEYRDEVTK